MQEHERMAIAEALMRASRHDDQMADRLFNDHPFQGESISARTVGNAYRERALRTRELMARVLAGELK